VVIVHYRDAAATLRCIASVRAQSERPQLVVVDNASPDRSGDELAEVLAGAADVLWIRSPHNGGFGAGCNLGLDRALAAWPELLFVLLLNPDAELAPDALGELLASAHRHPRAGIVGARIDRPDGSAWFRNGRIPRWTLRGFHRRAPAADEHRTGFVTGACMLLHGGLLRAGLRFHPGYFLYCEDAELCDEVLGQGHELWINQRARVVHIGGGSQPGAAVLGELSAERLYWLTRAKSLFARRRLGRLQAACYFVFACTVKPMLGLLLTRSTRWLGAYFRGLRDGARARRR
jgi:hypothetical protein